MISRLTNKIQIKLCYEHAIAHAAQSFTAAAVGCRHIRRAVEVPELCLCRFPVTTGEAVGKFFGSYPVDRAHKIRVCNGCISSFDGPKRFTEAAYSCTWIEHDFGSVQTKHHPIERVMATVANIDGDFAIYGVEHRMAVFAFHVVPEHITESGGTRDLRARCRRHSRALIEIANARDVVLAVLADDGASVAEHHGGVVTRVSMNHVAFVPDCGVNVTKTQRGTGETYMGDTITMLCWRALRDMNAQLLDDKSATSANSFQGCTEATLGGRQRRMDLEKKSDLLLARAEKEGRSPSFLQAANVCTTFSSRIEHQLNRRLDAAVLLVDAACGG